MFQRKKIYNEGEISILTIDWFEMCACNLIANFKFLNKSGVCRMIKREEVLEVHEEKKNNDKKGLYYKVFHLLLMILYSEKKWDSFESAFIIPG